jgi:hypothetical protein
MGQFVAAVLAGFITLVPALLFFLRQHHHSPARAMRRLKIGLMGFNIVVGLFAMGIGIVWLITAPSASHWFRDRGKCHGVSCCGNNR